MQQQLPERSCMYVYVFNSQLLGKQREHKCHPYSLNIFDFSNKLLLKINLKIKKDEGSSFTSQNVHSATTMKTILYGLHR